MTSPAAPRETPDPAPPWTFDAKHERQHAQWAWDHNDESMGHCLDGLIGEVERLRAEHLQREREKIDMTVLEEVAQERTRQDQKWGGISHDRYHTPELWVALITKHLGRALQDDPDAATFRKQMIRVSALAVAAIEATDVPAPVQIPRGR